MKDFKQTLKMKAEGSHYCGGGKVKKYAVGGKIGKIAEGLFPGALFGVPTAAAIYSNEKAKDTKVEEAAAKDKEAETKSAPVAKKRGGKITKVR